ncbi:MAG: hypothetical protein LBF33_02335 [Oscillospiraceae bacterium]|nr:hypothetical protein [Oscillospiraceae bacterium]
MNLAKCPYCSKKITYPEAWHLKKKLKFLCSECKKNSIPTLGVSGKIIGGTIAIISSLLSVLSFFVLRAGVFVLALMLFLIFVLFFLVFPFFIELTKTEKLN